MGLNKSKKLEAEIAKWNKILPSKKLLMENFGEEFVNQLEFLIWTESKYIDTKTQFTKVDKQLEDGSKSLDISIAKLYPESNITRTLNCNIYISSSWIITGTEYRTHTDHSIWHTEFGNVEVLDISKLKERVEYIYETANK